MGKVGGGREPAAQSVSKKWGCAPQRKDRQINAKIERGNRKFGEYLPFQTT